MNLEEFANPYKEISIGTHLVWVTIATIANCTSVEGTVSKCIRSYLALVVWLLIILNRKRSLWQRGAIFIAYLKINSMARIIENLSYSITVIKVGMIGVGVEQIICNNTIEGIQVVILLHFLIVAMCLPDGEEIESKLTRLMTGH
jgi:hypothetical protein